MEINTRRNKSFSSQNINGSTLYGSLQSIESELERNSKLDTDALLTVAPNSLKREKINFSDSDANANDEGEGSSQSHSEGEDLVKLTSSVEIKQNRLRHFTKQQWIALAGVCYVSFVSNTSISLMSSFFTQEAFSRGLTETLIGLIYGCYAIVVSLFCPLFGSLVPKVGTKTMFLSGQLTAGVCSFLFSQIFRITSTDFYAASCFVIRALQALGCAAYFTGATVIIAQVWKDNITFAMSMVELFTGLGMICGPLLGGWLYEVGGFQFPFIFIGIMMFIGLILNHFAIKQDQAPEAPGNFFRLLRNPNVVMTTLFTSAMMAAFDFIMPLLSIHMESLKNSSPVLVGVMFVILATSYAIITPILGLCLKTRVSERLSFVFGGVLVTISYLLLGPSHIFAGIHWENVSIWSISLAMAVLGAGESFATVAIFSDLTRSAISGGMNNDISTSGVVGGLFFSSVFFGEFIGPVIGGALMEQFNDFKTVSTIFSCALFIVTLCTGLFYFVDWMRNRNSTRPQLRREISISDEKTPLLSA